LIGTIGLFDSEGNYYVTSFIDYDNLKKLWMQRVLDMLVDDGIVKQEFADKVKKIYPKGFMVNGEIRDHKKDKNVMRRLAEYIARPVMVYITYFFF
jgi:predicted transcriptional regulator